LEVQILAEKERKLMERNASCALDQEEYRKQYDEAVMKYEVANAKLEKVSDEIRIKKKRAEETEAFAKAFVNTTDGFDEKDWAALLDYATVYAADDIRFTFRNGLEVKA
jgi:hypothetical protein